MEISEKELEDIIYYAEESELRSRGLFYKGTEFRQLKIGNYGIADIITAYRSFYKGQSILTINVYELKKGVINNSAFLQALRYCMGIKKYISTRKPDLFFKLRIILIGDSIDTNNDFIYISTLFDNESQPIANGRITSVNFYTYSFGINGFHFDKKPGYELINDGFGFIDDEDLPF